MYHSIPVFFFALSKLDRKENNLRLSMNYTLFLQKYFKIILLLGCFSCIADRLQAQVVVKEFYPYSLSDTSFFELKNKYGNKKSLPKPFEKQAIIALSYFPELTDRKIKFRVKNKITPLASRPSFLGMFQTAKKRTYIVSISKKSISFLNAIILHNLNYNAQIGVLGHELSHVSDFNNKSFGGMCKVILGHLSSKYVDRFEFNTDKICIDHGLGYQLLSWSNNVRENLKTSSWRGADD